MDQHEASHTTILNLDDALMPGVGAVQGLVGIALVACSVAVRAVTCCGARQVADAFFTAGVTGVWKSWEYWSKKKPMTWSEWNTEVAISVAGCMAGNAARSAVETMLKSFVFASMATLTVRHICLTTAAITGAVVAKVYKNLLTRQSPLTGVCTAALNGGSWRVVSTSSWWLRNKASVFECVKRRVVSGPPLAVR